MSDVLQVQGINSKGFGIIPKLVMQDKRLTAQAKAIYSYFASYAGGGQTAFPSRAKILEDLDIGKDKYYRHFNMLVRHGYVKAEQEKTPKGRFRRNVYTLMTDVTVSPCPSFPCPINKDTEPCPDYPYTENKDTNNNSLLENKQEFFKKNSPSVSPAPISAAAADGQDAADASAEKINALETQLRDNIDYDIFPRQDKPLVDEIIAIMVDTIMTFSTYVSIDGENKPRELVRRRLMELRHHNIELVIDRFNGITTPIKKKRQYLTAMLYNSTMELDAHYTNAASVDMHSP